MKIEGGAIIWARKTIDSDIFCNKPDKWFKIWFYLISAVNYMDKKGLARGTCFMKYDWIMTATKATKDQVKHCIEFLKKESMLATQKATHGFIINVLGYKEHQNLSNYESHRERNTKATEKPQRSHNILKNYKNLKNDKEVNNTNTSESSSSETDLNHIMVLYQKKFPEQRKLYGMAGVVRARDYFDGILEGGHTLEDIEEAINKSSKPAPWDIIKPKKLYTFHPY